MQNSFDNALDPSLKSVLLPLVDRFMEATDYAPASRRAVRSDLLKFGCWFVKANSEAFDLSRITTRDCGRSQRHGLVCRSSPFEAHLTQMLSGFLRSLGHVQQVQVGLNGRDAGVARNLLRAGEHAVICGDY